MKNEKVLSEIKELISKKNPKDNKKAKVLGMRNNVKLKELRKEFCQKCYYPLNRTMKTRIKNKVRVVVCEDCGKVYRWKIKE